MSRNFPIDQGRTPHHAYHKKYHTGAADCCSTGTVRLEGHLRVRLPAGRTDSEGSGYCQIASRQARLVSRRHDSDVALLHMAGVEGMEASGQVSRIWGGVSASLLSLVDSGALAPVRCTSIDNLTWCFGTSPFQNVLPELPI